jgi:predicted PurR-regulated permease PerM
MKKRRKKMTKDRDIKILIVLVSVFVIISLLVLSFQIKNKSDNLTASYNARKEDLQLKQTGLEKAILDLNNTLQQEKLTQQNLANELAALKNQTPPKPTGGSSNPPAPTPTPPPVTRAS